MGEQDEKLRREYGIPADCKPPQLICDATPVAPGNVLRRNSKNNVSQLDITMAYRYAPYAAKQCILRLDESVLKKIFIEGLPESRDNYLSEDSFRQSDDDERSKPFVDYVEAWWKSADDQIPADIWEKTAAATSLRARMCNHAKYLFGDNGIIAKRLLVTK